MYIIIVATALFLSAFFYYNPEETNVIWWNTYIPTLATFILSASWLLKPYLFRYPKEIIFKKTMLIIALIGFLSCFFAPRANTSIYAMCVTLSIPALLYFFNTNSHLVKIIVVIAWVICATAVITTSSRTGIISIMVSFYWLISTLFKMTTKRQIFAALCIVVLTTSLFLFVKKDSSLGRSFILKNTAKMIADKPLGWGHSGFEANYMNYQANYFVNNINEKAALLADDIKHPLNEYMYIAVNYGLPILLLILCGVAMLIKSLHKKNSNESKCFLHFITLLMIWCCFSYPLSIAYVWIIILAFIPFIPQIEHLLNKQNICYSTAILLLLYCGSKLPEFNDEMKWNNAIKEYKKGNKETAMKIFNAFEDYSIEKRNMLFSLATIEYNNKSYEKCIKICNECKEFLASYDLEILLANSYFFIGKYDKALEHFSMARYMCPNRFTTLYKQFKIYQEIGDTANMKKVGSQILKKNIKVYSPKIEIMINNVKHELNKI